MPFLDDIIEVSLDVVAMEAETKLTTAQIEFLATRRTGEDLAEAIAYGELVDDDAIAWCALHGHGLWQVAPKSADANYRCHRCGEKAWACHGGCERKLMYSQWLKSEFCDDCRPSGPPDPDDEYFAEME